MAGEIISRKERKAQEAAQAAEAAKILTVTQFADRVFMPQKAVTCSESTRVFYSNMLSLYVLPVLGEQRMPDVSSSQITALLLDCQKTDKAYSTIIGIYTTLHQLFKMAYLSDLIERNPMGKVERPRRQKEQIRQDGAEAYTAEEAGRILDALKDEPLKWQCFIRLLMDTGMRRGECAGLQWQDIDFAGGTITISRNSRYTPERGMYLDTPKNGHSRVVPVGAEALQLLRRLRDEQAATCVSKWIFTQEHSPELMHPDSPTRYMKRFSKRCGVDGLHPHKLRHTFASLAITAGADIASVSEILGHADKSTTLSMYTHADEESKRRASEIVRDVLRQKMA